MVRWLDHLTDPRPPQLVRWLGHLTERRARRESAHRRSPAAGAASRLRGRDAAVAGGGPRAPADSRARRGSTGRSPGRSPTLIDSGEFPAGRGCPPSASSRRCSACRARRCAKRSSRSRSRAASRCASAPGIFVAARRRRSAMRRAPVDDGPGPVRAARRARLIEGEIAALAARTRARSRTSPRCARRSRSMREHADDFAQARRRRPRVPRAHRRSRPRNGSLRAASSTGLWDQRRGELWTRIESLLPHAGDPREDARPTTRRSSPRSSARCRRGARGDAPASRARRARIPAPWDEIVPRRTKSRIGARRSGRSASRPQHATRRIHQGGVTS